MPIIFNTSPEGATLLREIGMETISAGYEFAHRDDYEGRRVIPTIAIDADSRNIEELDVKPDPERYRPRKSAVHVDLHRAGGRHPVGPHRDLAGDLAAAVRAHGLKMGYYYSLYEWYNPLWLSDKPKYIAEHMTPQFKDLVTRYKPSIIFSDGEWDMDSKAWKSEELLAWLYNESPVKDQVIVDDRWGKDTRHKHGGYYTTEYAAGMKDASHAWEESRGMAYSYGYNRAEAIDDYRTGRELIMILVDLVSRGGNFLLDIGPTADGRINLSLTEYDRLRQAQERNSVTVVDTLRLSGSFKANDLRVALVGRASGKLPVEEVLTGVSGAVLFGCEGDGLISRSSNERWSVCLGGSIVVIWSLNGNRSRCRSINSPTSSPSRGTGKPGNGPVTELHEENRAVSWYTARAAS